MSPRTVPGTGARSTCHPEHARSATMLALVIAAAIGSAAALSACGGDDASHDGEYTGDSSAGVPSVQTTPSTIDTPSTATSIDTAAAPPPSAAELRRQLAEKFDKMGGMERVNIETDGSGVVTLSGMVATADRKQTAEDAAAMVPGVVRVKNEIRVGR